MSVNVYEIGLQGIISERTYEHADHFTVGEQELGPVLRVYKGEDEIAAYASGAWSHVTKQRDPEPEPEIEPETETYSTEAVEREDQERATTDETLEEAGQRLRGSGFGNPEYAGGQL